MLGKQDVAGIVKMKVATAFVARVAAALAVEELANDGKGGCRGATGKRGSRCSVCKESQAVSFCGITHLVCDTFIFGHRSAKRPQDGQRSLGQIPQVASLGNGFVKGLGAAQSVRFGQAIATGGMAHCHKIWAKKWNVFWRSPTLLWGASSKCGCLLILCTHLHFL